jgi:CDP-glucose 4,6-dehydratase
LRDAGIALATARAGNVIGGGDWAVDRLLPDFLRAVDAGTTLLVRSPGAIRPWQHVLEPLAGYLQLAEGLREDPDCFAEAWNFGPADDDARSVSWVLDRLGEGTAARWTTDADSHPHEAGLLQLDSSKARTRLGWKPQWRLATALAMTLDWHRAWRDGQDMRQFSLAQIASYLAPSIGN